MFGYVVAAPNALSEDEAFRYRCCYCGLCRTLSRRYGTLSRFALTYDMAFLALLLDSLYEPDGLDAWARCPMHPLRPAPYSTSRFSEYAADLNLALAYYNCLDDWNDDRSIPRLLMAKRLEPPFRIVRSALPRQCAAIECGLRQLSALEKGPPDADAMSAAFGGIMAELFVPDEDHWAPTLRAFGEALGEFIYMMDACLDYRRDLRRGSPNPLRAFGTEPRKTEDDYVLLTMLMARCTEEFEKLPLVRDANLLRSILFTGVWQKFPMPQKQEGSRNAP